MKIDDFSKNQLSQQENKSGKKQKILQISVEIVSSDSSPQQNYPSKNQEIVYPIQNKNSIIRPILLYPALIRLRNVIIYQIYETKIEIIFCIGVICYLYWFH